MAERALFLTPQGLREIQTAAAESQDRNPLPERIARLAIAQMGGPCSCPRRTFWARLKERAAQAVSSARAVRQRMGSRLRRRSGAILVALELALVAGTGLGAWYFFPQRGPVSPAEPIQVTVSSGLAVSGVTVVIRPEPSGVSTERWEIILTSSAKGAPGGNSDVSFSVFFPRTPPEAVECGVGCQYRTDRIFDGTSRIDLAAPWSETQFEGVLSARASLVFHSQGTPGLECTDLECRGSAPVVETDVSTSIDPLLNKVVVYQSVPTEISTYQWDSNFRGTNNFQGNPMTFVYDLRPETDLLVKPQVPLVGINRSTQENDERNTFLAGALAGICGGFITTAVSSGWRGRRRDR